MEAIAAEEGLTIRRLRDEPEEYVRMARWRNEPHVRQWWDPDEEPMTVDAAIAEYRSRIDPASPTTACIIEADGQPIGYIQCYPWAAYPEDGEALGITFDDHAWGLDVFIGEPSHVGRGVGPKAIDLLCRHLFAQRGATSVELVAGQANARALRAYEKAGFRRGRSVLDTDTKDGRRVESWLLVRAAPAP